MKLRSMEEKISYRLFLMGFLGLLFTAALCIFVFHKAFTADRKSTRLNSSHSRRSRMPSSA